MLTKTESILRYIQQHPGCTNVMIAKDLALDATRVAALTGQMCKPTAGGGPRLRREPHSTQRAPGNQPVYVFFATSAAATEEVQERVHTRNAPRSATKTAVPALDGLIDNIARHIANRIVSGVGQHLAVKLSVILPEQPEQQFDLVQYLKEAIVPPAQKPEQVVRLPRVTIVGLLPQQAGLISSEFGQVYDLSFWKEEGIDRLKSLAKNSDHIITFSGKLPHLVENTIRSVNRDFKRVMGGMTELRRALNELSPA